MKLSLLEYLLILAIITVIVGILVPSIFRDVDENVPAKAVPQLDNGGGK